MADLSITDETVDAYRAAWSRSFAERGRDVDDVRAGLSAAGPLIVEQYLRTRIREAEPEPDDEALWERVREMAKSAALRTAAVDALRAAARDIRRELVCCDVFERLHPQLVEAGGMAAPDDENTKGHAVCYWGEAAEERAP